MKAYIVFYEVWEEGYGYSIFIRGVYTNYNKAKEVCNTFNGHIEEVEMDCEYDVCFSRRCDCKSCTLGQHNEGDEK